MGAPETYEGGASGSVSSAGPAVEAKSVRPHHRRGHSTGKILRFNEQRSLKSCAVRLQRSTCGAAELNQLYHEKVVAYRSRNK